MSSRGYFYDIIYSRAASGLPQHKHLSNQKGYSLNRPQEFIRNYGDYALRVLQMVRHGFSDQRHIIPPLETLDILWSCNTNTNSNHLTAIEYQRLVNKAISYLQELSPPKWSSNAILSRRRSAKDQGIPE